MKKSLLALAVLGAFAGAASAQSSVTIYGVIDASIKKGNDGTSSLNGDPNGTINNGEAWTVGPTTSNRLGFRGTEDLGGGMKANFLLEHRFSSDDGQPEAGTFWQGSSWVGVSGGFGEVRLGRQYVPAFYIGLASDPWGYDYNVAGANAWTRGGHPLSRASNAVTYLTPNMGGFTAQVQVAPGEGPVNAAQGNPDTANSRSVGFNVRYTAGPLDVGFGYNDLDQAATNRYWNLMGSYDLGFVKPILAYSRGEIGATETTAYLLGARAPMGAGTLKAVVARATVDTGAAETDTTKFGLGYEYALSKRTSVHADVGTAKTDGLTRRTAFEAGVKHVF